MQRTLLPTDNSFCCLLLDQPASKKNRRFSWTFYFLTQLSLFLVSMYVFWKINDLFLGWWKVKQSCTGQIKKTMEENKLQTSFIFLFLYTWGIFPTQRSSYVYRSKGLNRIAHKIQFPYQMYLLHTVLVLKLLGEKKTWLLCAL